MNVNRNCLSYWFPKLQVAGVPVPRTEIVRTSLDLTPLCDGKFPDGGEWEKFLAELKAAIQTVGVGSFQPVFLRTGQGSNKHQWDRTCFIPPGADDFTIACHVGGLVEWSHVVDMLGLAHDVWVIREYLPIKPIAVLPRYRNMPFVEEYRFFIEGGEVVCHHPYWPLDSIEEGCNTSQRDEIRRLYQQVYPTPKNLPWEAMILADQVALAFAGDGAWSVDILATERGWYVTDLAEAGRSFHWEGCPNQGREWGA